MPSSKPYRLRVMRVMTEVLDFHATAPFTRLTVFYSC